MIYISLKFIIGIILLGVGFYLCIRGLLSKKEKYRITFEYRGFTLRKDHNSPGESFSEDSWSNLMALGADGWEIATKLKADYEGIHYILKRETFHQS